MLTEKFARLLLILVIFMSLAACTNTFSWQEEVKLLDGRIITVVQKNRIDGAIPREFWLSIKLPELSSQEIVWHENLMPVVLNIYQNKLYVVGTPFTTAEFYQYGKPNPSYLGYRYEAGHWQAIPFKEIPEAIYDINMWPENMALIKLEYISLAAKEKELRDPRYKPDQRKIDPKYVTINF